MPAQTVTMQDCGCIALPEDVANALGMQPGVELVVAVDAATRSITLTSSHGSSSSNPVALAACPIQP